MINISWSELEDMEFYNPNFVKKDWENKLPREFMEYYKLSNTILDITTWVRLNAVSESMCYKEAYSNQICYIRDDISKGLFISIEYDSFDKDHSMNNYEMYNNFLRNVHKVDLERCSKSIRLPIYRIYADGKDDLVFTIGNNFYGYYVSVESKKPVEVDFKGLFDTSEIPSFLYGFKEERVFKSYDESRTRFSFGVSNKHHFYVIMWLISEWWKDNYVL